MAVYSGSIAESAGVGGPYVQKVYRTASVIESARVNSVVVGVLRYNLPMVEGIRAGPSPVPGVIGNWGLTRTESASFSASASYRVNQGALLAESVALRAPLSPRFSYHLSRSETMRVGASSKIAYLLTMREGALLAYAFTAFYGQSVTEGVRASTRQTTQGLYHLYAIESARLTSLLSRGVGAAISTGLGIQSALAVRYLAHVASTEGAAVNSDPNSYTHMAYHPAVSETAALGDVEILKAIYAGKIAEGASFFLIYAAPPTTTAWAMNTRNEALTEYRNWSFNSFASMGRKYLGANSQGIFELNGATDNGSSTVADLASGYLEMADGKLAGLKGVYLGLDGKGTYYLKLTAGNGLNYVYQFVSQPDLMTTKVLIGKGIRTRWLRWELISSGNDFDLDSIEFVPMISGRRV